MADKELHMLVVDCFAGTEWRQPITGEELEDHHRVAEQFERDIREPERAAQAAAEEIRRRAQEDPEQPLSAGLVAKALRI